MDEKTNNSIDPGHSCKRGISLSAGILCGGQSKRMGTAKQFLAFNGSTLIEDRYQSLSKLFPEVFLITNDTDTYSEISPNIVNDLYVGCGPMAGILSVLLRASYERTLVIACDTPLITTDILVAMTQVPCTKPVLALQHNGITEPLVAIYSKDCIVLLRECILTGNYRMGDFIERQGVQTYVLQDQEEAGYLSPCFNVNTPQDYTKLLLNSRRKSQEF